MVTKPCTDRPPIQSEDGHTGRAAGCTPGGGAPAVLPCLNTNNCNEGKKVSAENLSSVHRKTAFALTLNVLWLVERHGLARIGFLTLTFSRHVVNVKEAQKALHSLMTGVLKKRYPEYIVVLERMSSKRIHFHLLVVMAEGIRTGFDFAAVKRGDYRSASDYLRREWKFWRATAPKYGFGRTELLPIKKTAEGVAKYVGKYIAKHIGQRLPEDKGARLVRYSRGTNRAGIRFSWDSAGAYQWRTKLGLFCRMFNLKSGDYQEKFKTWFGSNWIYRLRPLILSLKLPAFYPANEAQAAYLAVWQVAMNEMSRRGVFKTKMAEAPPPVTVFKSWIEHAGKEAA